METDTQAPSPLESAPDKARQRENAAQPYPPKTTGEKWFDRVRFATGEGVILGLTAVLAYVARYGKKSYGRVPNVLQEMDEGIKKTLLEKTFLKDSTNGERIAGAVASTTTLMHGGNLFVPVMKTLQDHKHAIVDGINRRWGKPGEVEAGQDRLKTQEKESWGDIIKGRLGSWAIVFTSLLGADLIFGKKKDADVAKGEPAYWSDRLEDKVGRWVAGVTKEGREIAKAPLSKPLTVLQKENKAYRFGKILALDVFATTAALAIWTTISKFSAASRKKKLLDGNKEEWIPTVSNAAASNSVSDEKPKVNATLQEGPSHAARLGGKPVNYRALAERDASQQGAALS